MAPDDADRIRAALSPEQYAGLVEATEGVKREPGQLLVLGARRGEISQDAVRRFAEGAGLDPFMARQKLMAPFPRVLRREDRREEAIRWMEWMREAGIPAFVVSERRVLEFAPREAAVVVCEGGRLEFASDDMPAERADPADAICIVLGQVRTRVVRQSMPDALGLGHPGRTEVAASSVERVADVHFARDERVYRFRESTLKSSPGGAGVPRFRGALDALRAAAPGAVVVDGFGPATEALAESRRLVARSQELEFRPGKSFVPRVGTSRTSAYEESDAAAFDLYSLLSALQLSRA